MYYEDTGTWRDIATGVNPEWGDPTEANGATDGITIPGEPIYTRLEGPWGAPWWEGLEDPTSPTGLPAESPNPTYPNESVGALPLAGAYEPAVRTHGPVRAWGHEASGGLYGDQSIGRIMRFPANIPERYDPNGIWNIDYKDELAATLAANQAPMISDAEVTTNLTQWPNVSDY